MEADVTALAGPRGAQPLPHGRGQAGNRQLNFYQTSDNLQIPAYPGYCRDLRLAWSSNALRRWVQDGDWFARFTTT